MAVATGITPLDISENSTPRFNAVS